MNILRCPMAVCNMLRMHAIKNDLTKKLGSLLNDKPTYWYSMLIMFASIILVGKISKACGLGHNGILLMICLAGAFCFTLLLGSALLNLTPKEESGSQRKLLWGRIFARFASEIKHKYYSLVQPKYTNPSAPPPEQPPRPRA